MNRRELVIAGAAAAGTAAGVLSPVQIVAALPATLISTGHHPVFAVIFDHRFEAARAFAKVAAWRGNRVFSYDGDLTAVWVRQIEPRWSARAGALAGMTTPTALFCLEQLAAQHWLRVVSRTEPRARAATGEALISWVIA